MASEQATVDRIVDAMSGAGEVRSRKMFGEHAIYCDERVVAMVCNDQLFVKITDEGRALLQEASIAAPPYPGAKPHFLIAEAERIDPALMSDLIAATARALPPAPPKKKRSKQR